MTDVDLELVLFRPRGGIGRTRRIRVFVDDEEVGRLGSGERLSVEVTPGSHTVDARVGSNDVSNTVDVDVVAGASTTVAVTFRNPATVPQPGTGGSWQRVSLELRLAPDGSVTLFSMWDSLRSIGGNRSRGERVIWVVALLIATTGLFVVRPLNDVGGTIVAGAGAIVLVVMFFRSVLFRDDSRGVDSDQ